MRTKLKTVGLVVNTAKPHAREAAHAICRQADREGAAVLCETRAGALLGRPGLPLARLARQIDGLVVAGGDGTMLGTVPAAAANRVPVLGINIGSLGFLTLVQLPQAARAVSEFIKGACTVQSRSLLEVALASPGRPLKKLGVALNDAVFSRTESLLLVDFSVSVDGRLVTDYSADGIIVATPTGSTAYSLASHGALLAPDAPVWTLTPICPHTMTNRPVVVSDQAVVRVKPDPCNRLRLTLDGHREFIVGPDDEVEIRRAPVSFSLAVRKDYCFFKVLRGKLQWSGSHAARAVTLSKRARRLPGRTG